MPKAHLRWFACCCEAFLPTGRNPREEEDNHYARLGVEIDATFEEVRRAYKRRSLDVHPDKIAQRGGGSGGNEEEFQRLKEAYEVLVDPRKRDLYDALGTETMFYLMEPSQVDAMSIFKNFQGSSVCARTKIFSYVVLLTTFLMLLPVLVCFKVDRIFLDKLDWIYLMTPLWIMDGLSLAYLFFRISASFKRKSERFSKLLDCFKMLCLIFQQVVLALQWDYGFGWLYSVVLIPTYAYLCIWLCQSLESIYRFKGRLSKMVTLSYLKDELGKEYGDLSEEEKDELNKKYIIVHPAMAESDLEEYSWLPYEEQVKKSPEYTKAKAQLKTAYRCLWMILVFVCLAVLLVFRLDGVFSIDWNWWIIFTPVWVSSCLGCTLSCKQIVSAFSPRTRIVYARDDMDNVDDIEMMENGEREEAYPDVELQQCESIPTKHPLNDFNLQVKSTESSMDISLSESAKAPGHGSLHVNPTSSMESHLSHSSTQSHRSKQSSGGKQRGSDDTFHTSTDSSMGTLTRKSTNQSEELSLEQSLGQNSWHSKSSNMQSKSSNMQSKSSELQSKSSELQSKTTDDSDSFNTLPTASVFDGQTNSILDDNSQYTQDYTNAESQMESVTGFDETLGSYVTGDEYSTCNEYKSGSVISNTTGSTSHRSGISNDVSIKINNHSETSGNNRDRRQTEQESKSTAYLNYEKSKKDQFVTNLENTKANDWIKFNRTISSIESTTLPNISSIESGLEHSDATDMVNNTKIRAKQDWIKFNRTLSHDTSLPHSSSDTSNISLSIPYALDEQRQLSMVINNLKDKKSRLTTIESNNSESDATPSTSHHKCASASYDNSVILSALSNQTPVGPSFVSNDVLTPKPPTPPTLQPDLPTPIPPTPPRTHSPPIPEENSKSTYYEHETTGYPDDYEAMEIVSQACGSCFLIAFAVTFAALLAGKLESDFSAFWVVFPLLLPMGIFLVCSFFAIYCSPRSNLDIPEKESGSTDDDSTKKVDVVHPEQKLDGPQEVPLSVLPGINKIIPLIPTSSSLSRTSRFSNLD